MPKPFRKPRATISHVAQATSLSLATVSRAFSGDPSVRQATREKVLTAARSLGYRPHASARSLKQGSTGAIGVISETGPWIFYNNFHGPLLQGLTLAMGVDDRRMVFYFPEVQLAGDAVPAHDQVRLRGIEALADGWVDGGVVVSSHVHDLKTLLQLKKEGFPLVLLGPDKPVPGFAQLDSGLVQRTRLGLNVLASAGHRRIAYLGIAKDSLHNQVALQELQRSSQRLGFKFDPAAFFTPATYELLNPAELSLFADAIIARGSTAVLVATPEQAAILRDLFEEKGRRVPQDISLLAYGHPPLAQRAHPRPLSVIAADLSAEGERAYRIYRALLQTGIPQSISINWTYERNGATLAPPKAAKPRRAAADD